MQHLGAEHNRVKVKASLVWVPAAVVHAAKHLQNRHQVDAVGQGYAVLAIARKDVVVRANSIARANLGTLLSDGWHPKTQLALALQCGGLIVETTNASHVAIKL